MEKRNLVVTGRGKATKKPDAIEIRIDLSTIDKEYSNAVTESNLKVNLIVDSIIEFGLKKEDLKTTNYGVTTVYRSEKDSNNNYIQIFEGYSCFHDLKLEIDMDLELLGKILTSIDKVVSPLQEKMVSTQYKRRNDSMEISVDFTLKDKNSIKDEAIENAVKTAREKAVLIARASGVELGMVMDINYSFGTINVYSNTKYSNNRLAKASFYADEMACINPVDIEVDDNVTITFEIIDRQ